MGTLNRFVVQKPNLKYRVEGFRKGQSFIPKVGEMIGLIKEVGEVEIKSGNVRKPLPEELEVLKNKQRMKKKKKVK